MLNVLVKPCTTHTHTQDYCLLRWEGNISNYTTLTYEITNVIKCSYTRFRWRSFSVATASMCGINQSAAVQWHSLKSQPHKHIPTTSATKPCVVQVFIRKRAHHPYQPTGFYMSESLRSRPCAALNDDEHSIPFASCLPLASTHPGSGGSIHPPENNSKYKCFAEITEA